MRLLIKDKNRNNKFIKNKFFQINIYQMTMEILQILNPILKNNHNLKMCLKMNPVKIKALRKKLIISLKYQMKKIY
jgi:hypothetical protein